MSALKINICLTFLLSWLSLASKAQQNLALHQPVSVSSQSANFPASYITDGKISRKSKWESANSKPPHIVEIDLQRYCSISSIVVHSGVLDEEKKPEEMQQAAGFWSLKNFKLQYWDDANWSDFPKAEVHENRLVAVRFNFQPAISTYRIRLVCDDGEVVNIMEIEAFGEVTPNMPAPPSINSSIQKTNISKGPFKAKISVDKALVGKTMKFVGYNQGYYFPGSNISAWLEYANINSLRVWASLNAFVPEQLVQSKAEVNGVEEFDKLKAELRSQPEKNRFIKWNDLLPLYDRPDSSSTNAMVYSYALSELKRLQITVLLQLGSTDFNDTWQNKWKQWQRYYAIAFYSAKMGNVAMFAMQNEPNHRNSGPMLLTQWIAGAKIVSDAVHCAVNDVNRIYHKNLQPKFVGPVTAGNNTEWWAEIAKNNQTDYHGNPGSEVVDLFSTHSYNSPAAGYETRVANISKVWRENHPQGKAIPIMYTEIGRWMNAYLIDKEETMDSPSLFTEWAGIYSNNMKNGAYGMWAFKFANTASNTYPRGIKSGHHFIWQGKRVVEDAYKNIALRKKVTASTSNDKAFLVTDGDKNADDAWVSGEEKEKWIAIDLDTVVELGGAFIYTGSAGGVYTAPDRVRNFKLQYHDGNKWIDISGAEEKGNKYAQVFMPFQQSVKTSKIRFVSTDAAVKVREIKLFAAGEVPSPKLDFNVSGIQRTGEVVRLFAKGFKDERPLLKTAIDVPNNDLDAYTSFDGNTGNYYMWLVNRNQATVSLTIDLAALKLPVTSSLTAEEVGEKYYGEVAQLITISKNGTLSYSLSPQSVVLLTITPTKTTPTVVASNNAISVKAGANAQKYFRNTLGVQLDAANPSNNEVAYVGFDISALQKNVPRKAVLAIAGNVNDADRPYRLHVYAITQDQLWTSKANFNWNNAPYLDKNEALLKQVGTAAFIAGEMAFDRQKKYHYLDVTDLIKRHGKKQLTFVLVRETRQMGDDEDKGRRVSLTMPSEPQKPKLLLWQ
ncbi:discoidin domain-containing protein [Nubsella zeaxanthinifaciens]|uniref:discoidin domain-containing protein n=1 Tax=Nubsella zeaxanthinifaciens TaxID=392412 RepID=UPI003D086DF2